MNNASKGRCVTITPSDKPKKTLNFTCRSRKGKIINARFERNIQISGLIFTKILM